MRKMDTFPVAPNFQLIMMLFFSQQTVASRFAGEASPCLASLGDSATNRQSFTERDDIIRTAKYDLIVAWWTLARLFACLLARERGQLMLAPRRGLTCTQRASD